MTNMEIKRITMELLKVQAAKAELEYKIEERQQEILRIEDHIKVQAKREQELKEQLSKAQGE
jgi:chromosome segregation ATPase